MGWVGRGGGGEGTELNREEMQRVRGEWGVNSEGGNVIRE